MREREVSSSERGRSEREVVSREREREREKRKRNKQTKRKRKRERERERKETCIKYIYMCAYTCFGRTRLSVRQHRRQQPLQLMAHHPHAEAATHTQTQHVIGLQSSSPQHNTTAYSDHNASPTWHTFAAQAPTDPCCCPPRVDRAPQDGARRSSSNLEEVRLPCKKRPFT